MELVRTLLLKELLKIERIKNQFPNDIFTLLVQNPKVAKVTGNHADREVENYNYDFIVVNDSDLRALRKVAIDFCIKILDGKEVDSVGMRERIEWFKKLSDEGYYLSYDMC